MGYLYRFLTSNDWWCIDGLSLDYWSWLHEEIIPPICGLQYLLWLMGLEWDMVSASSWKEDGPLSVKRGSIMFFLVYWWIVHLQSKSCFRFQSVWTDIISGDFLEGMKCRPQHFWIDIARGIFFHFGSGMVMHHDCNCFVRGVAMAPWNSGLKWPTWERREEEGLEAWGRSSAHS